MLTFNNKQKKGGGGLLNSVINNLPFEAHLLGGYQFCGPGTKLEKRIKRGDVGINPLDAACKEHDIAYSKNKRLEDRHKADWILENRAWERVKSSDATLGEKANAWLVTTGMKMKRKLGMGIANTKNKKRKLEMGPKTKKVKRKTKQKKPISFKRNIVDKIEKSLLNNTANLDVSDKKLLKKSSAASLRAARMFVKKAGGRKNVRIPRIIPFKSGGILPLLPIFAGLGALGSLAGGASAIAKTVIDAKNAKKKLEEDKRHHQTMEEIGKRGSGLYLRKNNKGGYGLFLKKNINKKNYQ